MILVKPKPVKPVVEPMTLELSRHPAGLTCVIGDLTIDGEPFTHTLEDLPRKTKVAGETCIPAGTYRVVLTESEAVKQGRLWSPNEKGLLPLLLSVPGFEGIRIHAGNTDKNTRGCILVGSWRGGEFLNNSRDALSSLMDMLEIATIARRPIHIQITDPIREGDA